MTGSLIHGHIFDLAPRHLSEFCRSVAVFIVLLLAADASLAQHEGHDMGAMKDGKVEFRMPPMNKSMPMLPGLGVSLPPVSAFLAAMNMDPESFPEARPSEIVYLEDDDIFHLRAGIVRRTIAGTPHLAYGYNGQYPGPQIRAKQGSSITVEFLNNAEMPSTVRWHGLRGDNAYDGTPIVTQAPVPIGSSFTYHLTFEDAGVFWYHPQVRADIQMDLGLYGAVVISPREDNYYQRVNREEVLILDDVMIDSNGLFPWGEEAPNHALMGRFGNVLMVNGLTDYQLEVYSGEVIRYYLVNAANSRTFNVTFGDAPVKIIAADLSRYEQEELVSNVLLAPGERYIVEVEYARAGAYPIKNQIQAIDHFRGIFYPETSLLARVDVAGEKAPQDFGEDFRALRSNASVSAELDAYRRFFDKDPDQEIELTLRVRDLPLSIMRMMRIDTLYVPPIEFNDAMPMMNWLSTGTQVFWVMRDVRSGLENMEIFWDFDLGDMAKIRIHNTPRSIHPMNHPIHLHGQRFLVLDIDGKRNTNLAWKDTAIIPVASTVDLLVDMANPGEWVMHCHIAEHVNSGMMLSFNVWEND